MKIRPESVAISQPRASYFVGGGELISHNHTTALSNMGVPTTYYTIRPPSVGLEYSPQYLSLRDRLEDRVNFIEVDMPETEEMAQLYAVEPGENKQRWIDEARAYNEQLNQSINGGERVDLMLSYYLYDALKMDRSTVGRNALYLCGIPSTNAQNRGQMMAAYDNHVAISEPVRAYWRQYVPSQPIEVVPTGVAIPEITTTVQSSPLEITYAGRLIERKGGEDLISAIALLPSDLRNQLHVTMLGEGPQRQHFEQLIQGFNLGDSVQLSGLTKDLATQFMRSSLCIFPSRNGEGLMGVVLEAMAAGSCVIATTGNGNEAAINETRGVLIEPENPALLAQTIERLIADAALRRRMGVAARQHMSDHFSWEAQTESLFSALMR